MLCPCIHQECESTIFLQITNRQYRCAKAYPIRGLLLARCLDVDEPGASGPDPRCSWCHPNMHLVVHRCELQGRDCSLRDRATASAAAFGPVVVYVACKCYVICIVQVVDSFPVGRETDRVAGGNAFAIAMSSTITMDGWESHLWGGHTESRGSSAVGL